MRLGRWNRSLLSTPPNGDYQKEVSNLLAWLADARRAEGRVDDAIALRHRQIAFLEKLTASERSDVVLRQQLIPAHQALGLLLTSRGDVGQGIDQYELALEQATRLISVEPDNSLWSDMAASVRLELARNLLSLGRRAEADQQLAAGCATVATLRAHDANVWRWRTLQTTCLEVRARLTLAAVSKADALGLAEQALRSAQSERSGDEVMDHYRIAEAYRLLGDVRASGGNRDEAQAAWSAGLAQLPGNITERPWEMNERAELLRRLGRTAEARPLADRLIAIGYRSVT